MLTEQQWKLRLGMYKSGMIDFEDIYGTIVEQFTEASNGAKPTVSGSLPDEVELLKLIKEIKPEPLPKWWVQCEHINQNYLGGFLTAARYYSGNDR